MARCVSGRVGLWEVVECVSSGSIDVLRLDVVVGPLVFIAGPLKLVVIVGLLGVVFNVLLQTARIHCQLSVRQ